MGSKESHYFQLKDRYEDDDDNDDDDDYDDDDDNDEVMYNV